jgi:outer membrane immunogenic protein
MKSKFVCVAVLALAVSVSAEGQAEEVSKAGKSDLGAVVTPAADAAAYDWTGPYVGATVGGSFANVDHYYDRQNGNNDHGQVWLDASGVNFAANIGYNYQLANNIVLGAEAELGGLGLDEEKIVIKDDDVLRIDTGLFGSARFRAGYALDRFLPYVTAGVGFIGIENAGGNPANDQRFLTNDETRIGIVLGAGADYAFTRNLVAKLEYLYLDTPEYEVRNLENEMMSFDNDIHIVRAGLSYRF